MLPKIILSLLVLVKCVSCANILALMTVPSHSHHFWNSKYLEALAARGHRITYFSLDKYKNPPPNITQILVEGLYETFYAELDLTSLGADAGPYQSTLWLEQWDLGEAEIISKSEGMKKLINVVKKEKFDLVVNDVGSGVFALGVVDIMGRPPIVGITAYGVPTWTLDVLGNPMAYSSRPYFYSEYSENMTFLQRANNYFLHLFSFAVRWFYMRKYNEYSRQSFGENIRPLEEILDEINIIMVNSNHGLDYTFPTVPGLIPVGGLHIQKPKPLSQDLKTFLDEAKEGVVYFSLGSNIQSSILKKEKIDILTEAFRRLSPVKVLWKWESDVLPNKPNNVKIGKWFPQSDLLAHPNIRLFFTHSGMLSTQEAIYHGKPIVGMPFFLDQYVNVKKCITKGFGEELDFNNLTVDGIVKTIRKVLTEPKYTANAKRASSIFKDQMEAPLERAVYWTEYAIRHKGAPHFRHAARNLFWFQNWMLDVIVLTISIVFLPVFLVCKLTRGSSVKKTKQKKH